MLKWDDVNELNIISFNPKIDKVKKVKVERFLLEENLEFSESITFTVAVIKENEIIATGSLEDDVLKCFAIKKEFRKKNITCKIVKILTQKAFENNKTHLFVYTKPENCEIFKNLGYHEIIIIPNLVTLMENKINGFEKYLNNLKKSKVKGKKATSIVMNCNPFTEGHLYLIEKASKENDIVHLFIVTEDKSLIKAQDRINMVKEGTKQFKNVIIHYSGKYIISSATFPSYFIKNKKDIVKAHAYLDLTLFSKYIAKALDIKSRYIGEEPYSSLTKEYNEYMKIILPEYGVKVIEIPRKKINDLPVSASKVRKLLSEGKFNDIDKLVPKTTFDYLLNLKKFRRD